jgi:hypothetical protein
VSETAIYQVLEAFKQLTLKKIPGENVDSAVSLTKVTLTALRNASTPDRNYIPDDFPELVLKLFMTSSVLEFNESFAFEHRRIVHEADMTGKRPKWPTVESLTLLATNSYGRLTRDMKWTGAAQAKKSAFIADPSAPATPQSNAPKRACFNCGSPNHLLPDCPKPRDEEKIAKNRKSLRKPKSTSTMSSSSNNPTKKRTKTINGVPHVLNVNNQYVPDQRALRLQANTERDRLDAATQAVTAALQQTQRTPASTPASAPSPAPTPPVAQANLASTDDAVVPAGAVRAALASYFSGSSTGSRRRTGSRQN